MVLELNLSQKRKQAVKVLTCVKLFEVVLVRLHRRLLLGCGLVLMHVPLRVAFPATVLSISMSLSSFTLWIGLEVKLRLDILNSQVKLLNT